MSFLLRPTTRSLRVTPTIRTFATTRPLAEKLERGPDMGKNKPDQSTNSSAKPNADARSSTLDTDKQSSASTEEHKTGGDHPARLRAQPVRQPA